MADMEEYVVDKDLCIDCNACYTTYSEVFKQVAWEGGTKAEAFAPVETGKYNPWDVVGCCPVDAISKIGEMPAKPEKASAGTELPPLADQGPWEERWNAVKNDKESRWEIMKRYGMAANLTDEKDRIVIRLALPEKTPHHILTYKMGLPEEMPEYRVEVSLEDNNQSLLIKGFLDDLHVKSLCGKINSFPDRFRRKFDFNRRVEISRQVNRGKILTIELLKTDIH